MGSVTGKVASQMPCVWTLRLAVTARQISTFSNHDDLLEPDQDQMDLQSALGSEAVAFAQ
jgi:hypothetical protein